MVAAPDIPTAIPQGPSPTPGPTPTPGLPDNPIDPGRPIVATVSSPAQSDRYTFSANQGDLIEIRVVVTSGFFWPRVRVYDLTSGNTDPIVEENALSRVELTLTAPSTGTYRIIVSNYEGNRTGAYDLFLQKIN